jgi:hypothetical protein
VINTRPYDNDFVSLAELLKALTCYGGKDDDLVAHLIFLTGAANQLLGQDGAAMRRAEVKPGALSDDLILPLAKVQHGALNDGSGTSPVCRSERGKANACQAMKNAARQDILRDEPIS